MAYKENNLNKISTLTIERLTLYLRFFKRIKAQGIVNIFSHQLAEHLGITAHVIRKDLSQFGQFGNISSGYNVEEMIKYLSAILGVDKKQEIIIIGAGNLGRALLGYKGFETYGFYISAIFDIDESKTNRVISGVRCYSMSEIDKFIKDNKITVAILAVPATTAQAVAEKIVNAGIKGILNFSPLMLKLPENVRLIDVDFVSKLETLSYYVKNNK